MGILENICITKASFNRLPGLLRGQPHDRKSSSHRQRDLALLVHAELGGKLWCVEDVQVQQVSGRRFGEHGPPEGKMARRLQASYFLSGLSARIKA